MLAKFIDSTNLKQNASIQDIVLLCSEAVRLKVAAVCVHPSFVTLASKLLAESNVKVCAVIGFPLGLNTTQAKIYEARECLRLGANELDVVMNVASFKDELISTVKNEIITLSKLKDSSNFVLKVIVETALLTPLELREITEILSEIEVDYIKTSTGFAERGVTIQDVEIINNYKSPQLKIKASGGIKTKDFALQLIDLGVSRLGTSCASKILETKEI